MNRISLILLLLLVACGEAPEADPTAAEAGSDPQASTGDASAQLPPGHPPIDSATPAAGPLPAVPPGSGTGSAGLVWQRPDGWTEEQPSSSMRRAQYRVPGPGGDGEAVVFYFGPGQGGDAVANAQRWANQFAQPDGRPSAEVMTTETITVGDIAVLMVEVTGTYSGGMAMGAPVEPTPDAMLLGAIAQGADANWFFKLTGPRATIEGERDAFRGLIRSLRPGS